jgi:hypothetical protein
MKAVTHWILATFCAFLSLTALLASVGSPDGGWWRPAFFAFLPLRALRQRLIELDQKGAT